MKNQRCLNKIIFFVLFFGFSSLIYGVDKAEPELKTIQERLKEESRNEMAQLKPAQKEGMALTETYGIGTYEIDVAHSNVGFKIRHLISIVKGNFLRFQGTMELDTESIQGSSVTVVIDASSIHTNHDKRDNHLRSSDFLDATKFPTIIFKSKRVLNDKIIGDLTLHGVTKEITLNYIYHGLITDGEGILRAGFTATTQIDRRDFGITYNKEIPQAGALLGYEVPIEIEIEAFNKK